MRTRLFPGAAAAAAAALLAAAAPGLFAQPTPQAPDSRLDAIERRLSALEAENARLRAELAARPTTGPGAADAGQTTSQAVLRDAEARSGMPDGTREIGFGLKKGIEIHAHDSPATIRLGANFDTLTQARDFGPRDQQRQLGLREVELAAEADVAPWLYGAIFLTRPGKEAFNVEEAYADIGLPDAVKVRAGFGRVPFGYLNTVHEPERPQVSLPLPIVEFFGEEQLREGNLTAGRLFDLGGGYRVGASAGLWNADNDVAFNGGSGLGKAYSATVSYGYNNPRFAYQLGASVLTGYNDADDSRRTTAEVLAGRLYVDPSYNAGYDFPARFSLFGELLFNQRQLDDAPAGRGRNDALGAWVVADYQFAKSHHAGAGYEFTQGLMDRDLAAQAFSAHYTWYYTGHSRLQLELRRVEPAEGRAGWEALLQLNVVLGPHRERPFLPILDLDAAD